jgi:hypothetical protein
VTVLGEKLVFIGSALNRFIDELSDSLKPFWRRGITYFVNNFHLAPFFASGNKRSDRVHDISLVPLNGIFFGFISKTGLCPSSLYREMLAAATSSYCASIIAFISSLDVIAKRDPHLTFLHQFTCAVDSAAAHNNATIFFFCFSKTTTNTNTTRPLNVSTCDLLYVWFESHARASMCRETTQFV